MGEKAPQKRIVHPNRSHFWAGDNGWSCLDCGKFRWELRRSHPAYRPTPWWARGQ